MSQRIAHEQKCEGKEEELGKSDEHGISNHSDHELPPFPDSFLSSQLHIQLHDKK
jgi:hypothetical protein